MLEMKIVLRAVVRHFDLIPVSARSQKARRRGITISPANGCTLVLRDSERHEAAEPVAGSPRLATAIP
jgi:cytochrome P450